VGRGSAALEAKHATPRTGGAVRALA